MLHQAFEDCKFFAAELDELICPSDVVGIAVEGQVAGL